MIFHSYVNVYQRDPEGMFLYPRRWSIEAPDKLSVNPHVTHPLPTIERSKQRWLQHSFMPICSMYSIFTYIWAIFRANVCKYSIHGAYGMVHKMMINTWYDMFKLKLAFWSTLVVWYHHMISPSHVTLYHILYPDYSCSKACCGRAKRESVCNAWLASPKFIHCLHLKKQLAVLSAKAILVVGPCWCKYQPYPIGSMYAIYGNIYHQYTPNVSIYTIYHTWIPWVLGLFLTNECGWIPTMGLDLDHQISGVLGGSGGHVAWHATHAQ